MVKLTNKVLRQMIKECVEEVKAEQQQLNEEQVLRNEIRKMIKESLDEKKSKSSKKDSNKNLAKGKRQRVLNRLKSNITNCAPLSYKLWPDKEKRNARSQFYKCRDGEKNDFGDEYSFTDDEILKIQNMLSNTRM